MLLKFPRLKGRGPIEAALLAGTQQLAELSPLKNTEEQAIRRRTDVWRCSFGRPLAQSRQERLQEGKISEDK